MDINSRGHFGSKKVSAPKGLRTKVTATGLHGGRGHRKPGFERTTREGAARNLAETNWLNFHFYSLRRASRGASADQLGRAPVPSSDQQKEERKVMGNQKLVGHADRSLLVQTAFWFSSISWLMVPENPENG